VSQFKPPGPTPRDEPGWLQPFALTPSSTAPSTGRRAGGRYEQTEAISWPSYRPAAAAAAPGGLLHLARRLGFHAASSRHAEVSVQSVKQRPLNEPSASLQRRQQPAAGTPAPPAAGSPAEDAIVATFARAWESADRDALWPCYDDVFIAMLPSPSDTRPRTRGPTAPASLAAGHRSTSCRPEPTATPPFGHTCAARPESATRPPSTLLTLTGGRIFGMTRFEQRAAVVGLTAIAPQR